jgi:hypothetical protein
MYLYFLIYNTFYMFKCVILLIIKHLIICFIFIIIDIGLLSYFKTVNPPL